MRELMDGLLLGDGSLSLRKRSKNARYLHSCKHEEYLKFLSKELYTFGVKETNIYKKDNGYKTGYVFQYLSRVHPELTIFYNRWYSEGKKKIPLDLHLTPTVLLHWYLGDGGFDSDKGYLRQICLAAHSFSYKEREILCKKLRKYDLKVRNTNQGKICISKNSILYFLSIIGQSPVTCYNYKFDVSIFNKPQPKYKS